MILYSNGCSHTAVKENAAAHIFFDSLWMTKRYEEIHVAYLLDNKFAHEREPINSKTDWESIISSVPDRSALHFHQADHGKNNQRIFIETIDFVSRLIQSNKKPDFCIIQWSGPSRKLDFDYESTYTYDYSKYNDMFMHSVTVNPHDNCEKGLLVEPFASKVTLQYMLMLQNFFLSYDIDYAFIPYMELEENEFILTEYNLLDKSKCTANPFIGHRNEFRKKNMVTDFNGHPNLLAGNHLVEKLYRIFDLGHYDFSIRRNHKSERLFKWYKKTSINLQKDIVKYGNQLQDGEESLLKKLDLFRLI